MRSHQDDAKKALSLAKKNYSGYASSIFQTSGPCGSESNWTEAIKNKTVPPIGDSVEHWTKFEEDLDMMRASGANTYRFSLEWSQIQLTSSEYNEIAIAQYRKMFRACKERGLEPMITLFHFVEPLWFTKLGGFERESNIHLFLDFCKKMFSTYQSEVTFWCTINEPAIYAFSGYLYGQFPPHKHNLQLTVDVMTNLLKAHVLVYQSLKSMPGGDAAQIGLVHNSLKFVPRYWWEPVELITTKLLTQITNDIVMTFLKTGKIDYYIPLVAYKKYSDPTAISSFDFMGLNFYANPVIGFNKTNGFGPTSFPGQVLSDMDLPIDPQGFSAAIDEFASFKKPVYVTETGIADRQDKLRQQFLEEYLTVFQAKVDKGVDVRGIYFWSFIDNYEWDRGFAQKFGAEDATRKERDSMVVYKKFMFQFNELSDYKKPDHDSQKPTLTASRYSVG